MNRRKKELQRIITGIIDGIIEKYLDKREEMWLFYAEDYTIQQFIKDEKKKEEINEQT